MKLVRHPRQGLCPVAVSDPEWAASFRQSGRAGSNSNHATMHLRQTKALAASSIASRDPVAAACGYGLPTGQPLPELEAGV